MQNKDFKLPASKIGLFFINLVKWFFFSIVVGIVVGSISASFLLVLNWVTNYREAHLWLLALLPIGGLLIGFLYHYYGNTIVKGNNLLLDECHSPKVIIPFRMVPIILFSTLVTHLFGGSAGREGTAVQMGGALADQLSLYFKLNNKDRKTILIIGISAGFAAIFGTPFAAALFAIEVLVSRKINYKALFPSLLTALIANIVVSFWHVTHTNYPSPSLPNFGFKSLFWIAIVGILFGLTALLFSKSVHATTHFFKSYCKYPPLRPLFGGIVIIFLVWILGTTKYIGLGIPTIEAAFQSQFLPYDWVIKLALTAITLGAGFKGGEVTPLFFIGATLGNALFLFIPLPISILAAIGFVAIFAAATNTPVASTVMGIELFGIESGVYLGLACFIAYLFSGTTGIYTSQKTAKIKRIIYGNTKKKGHS